MDSADISVTVVLSSFGSGSTAVSGFLDKCGMYSCPPHQRTNDERTPNSYEPRAYRDALADCIDEFTLKPQKDIQQFSDFFAAWLEQEKTKARDLGLNHITIKHPLQTFVLPVIDKLASPKYVVVTRPFSQIEETRLRRDWHKVYGQAGARVIYNTLYAYLHESGKPYLVVPFGEFKTNETLQRQLLAYLQLSPSEEQLMQAQKWLF